MNTQYKKDLATFKDILEDAVERCKNSRVEIRLVTNLKVNDLRKIIKDVAFYSVDFDSVLFKYDNELKLTYELSDSMESILVVKPIRKPSDTIEFRHDYGNTAKINKFFSDKSITEVELYAISPSKILEKSGKNYSLMGSETVYILVDNDFYIKAYIKKDEDTGKVILSRLKLS